jgi:hypothetical protein
VPKVEQLADRADTITTDAAAGKPRNGRGRPSLHEDERSGAPSQPGAEQGAVDGSSSAPQADRCAMISAARFTISVIVPMMRAFRPRSAEV